VDSSLALSPEERSVLTESLDAYLVDLRRETAASESREVQHVLARRQEVLEGVLQRLHASR
jgi:hypothetical protein